MCDYLLLLIINTSNIKKCSDKSHLNGNNEHLNPIGMILILIFCYSVKYIEILFRLYFFSFYVNSLFLLALSTCLPV